MAGLSLRNVNKAYGAVEVIDNLNLEINSGEFLVLVGPSGCGKSTLLRMIAGLEEVTDGTISIDGKVINELPAARRELSMVFQSYALYPHMSVRKNLAFGLTNLRMPKPEIEKRVAEAAQILQIEPLMERRPRQLSGGQKQRVAIGRAIVREPKLFLFDEPLSNLDAELRVQMRVELASLYKRLGTTMIYVTHDQIEAMTMATRIVVLNHGVIEQVGTPFELYNQPRNLFVAGFIGSPKINMLEGRVSQGSSGAEVVLDEFGTVTPGPLSTADETVTVCIRPEHLSFSADGPHTATGEISLVEYLGSEIYAHVRMPSGKFLVVHASGRAKLAMGDAVTVSLDPDFALFFDGQGQRIESGGGGLQ